MTNMGNLQFFTNKNTITQIISKKGNHKVDKITLKLNNEKKSYDFFF